MINTIPHILPELLHPIVTAMRRLPSHLVPGQQWESWPSKKNSYRNPAFRHIG
jgi:hypothetical protein